jgi:hypothetical protein
MRGGINNLISTVDLGVAEPEAKIPIIPPTDEEDERKVKWWSFLECEVV